MVPSLYKKPGRKRYVGKPQFKMTESEVLNVFSRSASRIVSGCSQTMMFMKHSDIAFILATGGPSMVKAAYSSGTPAIGVGAGNAPVWICADADMEAAAQMVVSSKSFDNGVLCGSENNLAGQHARLTGMRGHLQWLDALAYAWMRNLRRQLYY
jgi:hypothetical protein